MDLVLQIIALLAMVVAIFIVGVGTLIWLMRDQAPAAQITVLVRIEEGEQDWCPDCGDPDCDGRC